MAGAYETKQYRNVFAEYGYSEEEIEKRVQETFETIFHGSEEERFYHEAGEDRDLWKIPAIMMRGPRACRMA